MVEEDKRSEGDSSEGSLILAMCTQGCAFVHHENVECKVISLFNKSLSQKSVINSLIILIVHCKLNINHTHYLN